MSLSAPGGEGGERGVISRHGLRADPQETLEPDGEAVLLGHRQADGGRLLILCAGLAGRHDAQHCGGDAVQGLCFTLCVCEVKKQMCCEQVICSLSSFALVCVC